MTDTLLIAIKDLLGDLPGDLRGSHDTHLECIGCGREYTGDTSLNAGDECPDDDCPRVGARAAIAKAESR